MSKVRNKTARSPLFRLVGGSMLALALVLPTACGGSSLSPKAVRAANEALAGETTNGAPAADGSGVTGDTGGTTTTGDTGSTGTGSTGGTGSGTGTGSGASGGGGSTGKGGGGGSTSTGGGGGSSAGTSGVKAGSCAGFKNTTGITDSTITIGNASDISGPVPGIFTSAQQAVKAYIQYFNATTSICGRKLALSTQDSRTDAAADQQAYQSLCSSSFAAVGSMSAFDSGGAATAQSCGLPDIRTATTTNQRAACTTCFAAQGSNAAYYENAPATYFVKHMKAASQHAAILYLDAGGAAQNAETMRSVFTKAGEKIPDSVFRGIGVTEFNYGPYVQAMKSAGTRIVYFIGPYQDSIRLQQAMQQASFKPDAFVQDPTIYDADYVKQVGSAAVNTYVYLNFVPFEEASSNREMSTYLKYLQQVAPGANPTFYGAWAWSATALFVREAIQLGGKLTRANLVAALRKVNNWNTGGMTAPQNVGGKINGPCWGFVRLVNGKWKKVAGYQCDGVGKA